MIKSVKLYREPGVLGRSERLHAD